MFRVYFKYPTGNKVFLVQFITENEAQEFRKICIEYEGWTMDDEDSKQYTIESDSKEFTV